jgi:two-component system NtrC family sensor kinase
MPRLLACAPEAAVPPLADLATSFLWLPASLPVARATVRAACGHGLERARLILNAKQEWEQTVDAIRDPLMLVGADYRVARANRAMSRDLGRPVTGMAGGICHEMRAVSAHPFAGGGPAPCDGCPVARALGAGAPADAELTTAGGRVYLLRAYPIATASGRPTVVCAYHEVTEERELARQLAQADKMAAIGQLAGGVAHEINNPLGAILALAQLLLRECGDAEDRESLTEIERSALRAKRIVESLLRFSRRARREERGPVFVNDVVEEAVFLVERQYRLTDVRIVRELAPDLSPVTANYGQLEQVALNLLTNAYDAVGARGEIRVRTRNVPGGVELAVADDGCGIREADLPHVFEPFFTTKPEGKGTGLGLAVSYGIVSDHQGRFDVRSRPGEGTEFTVTLPRAR